MTDCSVRRWSDRAALIRVLLRGAAIGLAALIAVGCATRREVHQFEPFPVATVGAEDLEPVGPPSMTELLSAASDAFKLANAAEERGDHAVAMRQYRLMLELLLEAELDPTIFHNVRGEFETILATAVEQANLFERRATARVGRRSYTTSRHRGPRD